MRGRGTWDLSSLMNTGSVFLISLTHHLYAQDIQCKILHRVYYTNAKLAKIYPSIIDSCNRCKQSPADLIHMLWECPKLFNTWTKIFISLRDTFAIDLDNSPLLDIFEMIVDVNLSVPARRLILLKWKHASGSPPSFDTFALALNWKKSDCQSLVP